MGRRKSLDTVIQCSAAVEEALRAGRPVVALESSVIAQGLPRPMNLEAAVACEEAIVRAGATPATIAVIDGVMRIGLERQEIEMLAGVANIEKAGARDLPRAVSSKATMATTVGATITAAHAVDIAIMATGGLGGVHRGYPETLDASNDLFALAEVSVVVVSAGFKSILDLSRTLEFVETLGIPMIGYRTHTVPNFYSADSGFAVPRADSTDAIAEMVGVQRILGLKSGMIVLNPPPIDLAMPPHEVETLVEGAVDAAFTNGVRGKEVTPFLLKHIADHSGGRSVALNIGLLVSNAALAANIAVSLAAAPG